MPHSTVLKAQLVLACQQQYPEVIINDAQRIIAWSDTKRAAIRAIWEKRQLWHNWIALRKNSNQLSMHKRSLEASIKLGRGTDVNSLHVAKQYIGKTYHNVIEFVQFEARLKLFECVNIAEIYRYMSCVNARRYDDSLQPVSFLGRCGHAAIAEILAWKIMCRT